MGGDSNIVMKKLIQKITDNILLNKKYSPLKKVEIFFTFGSPRKTAMCQWVYGMKIFSNYRLGRGSDIVSDLQKDIRRATDKAFEQSVCLTDIMFDSSE